MEILRAHLGRLFAQPAPSWKNRGWWGQMIRQVMAAAEVIRGPGRE